MGRGILLLTNWVVALHALIVGKFLKHCCFIIASHLYTHPLALCTTPTNLSVALDHELWVLTTKLVIKIVHKLLTILVGCLRRSWLRTKQQTHWGKKKERILLESQQIFNA